MTALHDGARAEPSGQVALQTLRDVATAWKARAESAEASNEQLLADVERYKWAGGYWETEVARNEAEAALAEVRQKLEAVQAHLPHESLDDCSLADMWLRVQRIWAVVGSGSDGDS